MPWIQLYDPLGNAWLSTLAAEADPAKNGKAAVEEDVPAAV